MKRMQEQAMAQQQAEMDAQLQQMQMQQVQQPPQGAPTEAMPQEPQQPDLASQLDMLRQQVPEIANMSDDEIVQLLAGMNQNNGGM